SPTFPCSPARWLKRSGRRVQAFVVSCLSYPGRWSYLVPPLANSIEVCIAQSTGLEHAGVLLPPLRFGRADNRDMHAGYAKREAKGVRDALVGFTREERVV